MKFFHSLTVALLLFSASTLKIHSQTSHQGVLDDWNIFWDSLTKGNQNNSQSGNSQSGNSQSGNSNSKTNSNTSIPPKEATKSQTSVGRNQQNIVTGNNVFTPTVVAKTSGQGSKIQGSPHL